MDAKLDRKQFNWLLITPSIVQGYGLVTILFIIFIVALCSLCDGNYLCKFVDDLSLLTPEPASIGIDDIRLLVALNKLSMHKLIQNQGVFSRPGIKRPIEHSLSLSGFAIAIAFPPNVRLRHGYPSSLLLDLLRS